MTFAPDSRPEVRLSLADIEAWEAMAVRHREAASALIAEAEALTDRASKARDLLSFMLSMSPLQPEAAPPELQIKEQTIEVTEATPAHAASQSRRMARKGSWGEALTKWIYASDHGLTANELRSNIAESEELSAAFGLSDKGFYHALSRLQKYNEIKKFNGRYYSPKAFSDIDKDKLPTIPISDRYSPMGEAIMDIVQTSPGITGPEIIHRLKGDPDFDVTLTPHHTGAYNIMARLVKREQIVRDDGRCYPGPEMPPRNPNSKWLKNEEATM